MIPKLFSQQDHGSTKVKVQLDLTYYITKPDLKNGLPVQVHQDLLKLLISLC